MRASATKIIARFDGQQALLPFFHKQKINGGHCKPTVSAQPVQQSRTDTFDQQPTPQLPLFGGCALKRQPLVPRDPFATFFPNFDLTNHNEHGVVIPDPERSFGKIQIFPKNELTPSPSYTIRGIHFLVNHGYTFITGYPYDKNTELPAYNLAMIRTPEQLQKLISWIESDKEIIKQKYNDEGGSKTVYYSHRNGQWIPFASFDIIHIPPEDPSKLYKLIFSLLDLNGEALDTILFNEKDRLRFDPQNTGTQLEYNSFADPFTRASRLLKYQTRLQLGPLG